MLLPSPAGVDSRRSRSSAGVGEADQVLGPWGGAARAWSRGPMTVIEEARCSVRAAQVPAQCAECLAMVCERRARLACSKAPMFLIEASRLRVAAARQLSDAHRNEADVAGPRYGGALYGVQARKKPNGAT